MDNTADQVGGLSLPGLSLPNLPGLPSLPKLPGLSSLPKIPGLPSLPSLPSSITSKLPGAAPIVAAIAPPAAPATGLAKYIPFNVEWFGLFILAGGIPFPPFSYLGYGGLNLWATGSLMYFAMKAATQAFLVFINTFVSVYYPNLWWVGYLLVLNPWYVFDILQMFSPAFAEEGYKVPFTHFNPAKPVGKPMIINGKKTFAAGKVTGALLAAALVFLGTGTYGLLNMLPPSITAGYKPIVNTIFAILGAITAIGGGSFGMMMLPTLIKSLQSNSAEYTASVAAVTPQTGGSSELPSLDKIANDILEHKTTQTGGGSTEDLSSNIFLGTLTIVTLAGISLALARSKTESGLNV